MKSRRTRAFLAIAAATLLVAALPGTAAEKAVVQMSSGVMIEGLTVEQHRAFQAEVSARLLGELPEQALRAPVSLALDPAELAAIDEADTSISPLRIGLVVPIAPVVAEGLDPEGAADRPRRAGRAVAVRGADGGWVWARAFRAERAGALRLHLRDVSLPEGAELWVYTRDGEAYGPYTGTGPDGDGDFWVTTVFGPEAILQLRVPASAALEDVTLRVTEVGALTERFAGTLAAASGFCGNASCLVDASCYSAANAIRNAYAKMEWVSGAYIYTCTGGLLADGDLTKTHYVLTANHCLSKSATAKGVIFYWSFATSTCNGSCPSNTGWPYKTTSASVAATNRKGDFTLLLMNGAPPSGATFLGWTNEAVANTNGVKLRRVSNPQFGPQVYSEHSVDTSAGQCRSWPRGERIYSRDTLGGTDGGSSGSPVVRQDDNKVVGQLSGACGTNVSNPCDKTANATVDGAFSYYFATVQPFLK
jgi:V8-like Glu-specific endopeptidase